jgi:hypothetical protein
VDVWEGIAPASSGEPRADPLRNRGETHRIGVHGIARSVAIPAHEKIISSPSWQNVHMNM